MKLLRFLLLPFAIIYGMVTAFRNLLFDKDLFKSTSFQVPVIVVGNLSVGGTGKTPQIEYLIRLLKDSYKVAVLSRGYKRQSKGFVLINENHSTSEVGDEPMQYFRKFPQIKVAVDAKRVEGIKKLLIASDTPEIILLDDAFQHRKVKAGYYVLLTKYDDLFSDDFLLPTGNLRESRSGARRADVILVTKSPKDLSVIEQDKIRKKMLLYSSKKVLFTAISYSETLKGSQKISLSELENYEVVLVTGIANPSPLTDFLTKKKISFKHLKFPDHHHFSVQDIDKIKAEYKNLNSVEKIIITTEKDYVRLFDTLENLSYIEIETLFLENQAVVFDDGIAGFVNRF
jgi:tetraacyldisaccharide 4'-kinase